MTDELTKQTLVLPGEPDAHIPPHFGNSQWLCECCGTRSEVMYYNASWFGISLGDILLCRLCRTMLPPEVQSFCVAYLLREGKPHPRIEDLHAIGREKLRNKSNGQGKAASARSA